MDSEENEVFNKKVTANSTVDVLDWLKDRTIGTKIIRTECGLWDESTGEFLFCFDDERY